MKKIFFLLLIFSSTYAFAQQTSATEETKKTKIKIKIKGNPNTGLQKSEVPNKPAITTANPPSTTIVLLTGWRTDPAALPVIGNDVPADIVTIAKNKYGDNIYDIKKIKSITGQTNYAVRIMENGQYQTYNLDADGNVIAK